MNKRVLVIADVNSFWTRRYVENLLLPEGYQVTIFPIWGDEGTYAEFYREQGVQVYQDRHKLPVIRHIPRLRMWARIWLNAGALRKLGPFDVIHNHYLSRRDLALGEAVAKHFPGARWVCTSWGSDLLRASQKHLAQMKPYLLRCHAVTVLALSQKDVIRKACGDAIAEKTAFAYFGQETFDDIDRVRGTMTKDQCKAHFGIAEGQRVVCVGSNASPAQHQPEVLDALAHLSPQELSDITLVLPMTYGGHDQDYVRAVEEKAASLSCQCVFLRDFMDGTESAKLCLAADAFIFAIETDSFSATLREHLYAGTQALIGDWLRYPQLVEMGIETIPFADFPEIPALLMKALSKPITQEELERRRTDLRARYSWDAARGAWLEAYGK